MTTAGIHNISRADYDRLGDRVHWSRLKHMERSPAHYRQALLQPSPDTDARQRGRAVHVATFEPERFAAQYAAWDGPRRGKEWEKFRDACEARGGEAITESMMAEALDISRAVRADQAAAPYLSGGRAEVTVLWTHQVATVAALPGYEIDCRGRPDFLSNTGAIVDLKTCRDASPQGFARQVMAYSYHAQAAFYVDGFAAATGGPRPRFVFVAVETAPPWAVTVYRVPDAILQVGREKYRGLLDRLDYCRRHSVWPAYQAEEVELHLPSWDGGVITEDDPTGLGLAIGG